MTESLLERSARYIDGAIYEGPRTINPIDGRQFGPNFRHGSFAGDWVRPEVTEVHATRAEVYRVRRDRELSLMARGLYLDASRSSEVVSQPLQAPD